MVISVAMDSREGDPREWIEKANPTYVTLIDRFHRVAGLYHMVNVPQAVWIDEGGRIVRPTESAGAYEGFRKMDRTTLQVPEEVAKITADSKETYMNAVRDWVLHGESSQYAFDDAQRRAHLGLPTEEIAAAHVAFTLGQYLIQTGKAEDGGRLVQEAVRLHPQSWTFWRQQAGLSDRKLASQPDFWQRVDALGDKKYYAAVDMKGMPQ